MATRDNKRRRSARLSASSYNVKRSRADSSTNACPYDQETYEQIAEFIKEQIDIEPLVGIVLGTGLNRLAESLSDSKLIAYEDIPNFPVSTVEGHEGKLVFGHLANIPVVMMKGRFHIYEGYTQHQITLPICVMPLLGVKTLILTNAAGGISDQLVAGDLLLIEDHINLPAMSGFNPLIGAPFTSSGDRFISMVNAYDSELRKLAVSLASQRDIDLKRGVYVSLCGPSFETPAEIRMLKLLGADVVGMSTASEVIVARRFGLRVLAFSVVTNMTVKDASKDIVDITHESVLKVGETVSEKLQLLVQDIIKRLNLTNNNRDSQNMDVSIATSSVVNSKVPNNSNDGNNYVNDNNNSDGNISNNIATENSTSKAEPILDDKQ